MTIAGRWGHAGDSGCCHGTLQEITQMASSRGPGSRGTTASLLAGGRPSRLTRGQARCPRVAPGGGPPTPVGCHAAQARNGAPGEGVAQYTQCRGEACKSRGAGQSPGRGPRAGHVPWMGRPGPGLDDGALLALEGGMGGRPGQQQLLLVDQFVQQVLLAVVVVDFQEGQDGDGQPGQPRGPEAELWGQRVG